MPCQNQLCQCQARLGYTNKQEDWLFQRWDDFLYDINLNQCGHDKNSRVDKYKNKGMMIKLRKTGSQAINI